MISWMQKHNKYLVWTIWIATIAFIGAGFVGWGSYNFGTNAGNIAKIGNIDIKQKKLNMVYSNIYSRVNQQFQGKLDDKKAKELGLAKQAFSTLATQAKILNFAKDMGIVVSNAEILTKLEAIKAFQKDGKLNKEIYNNYLRSQRLKAKDFEETLKEELIITKTMALMNTEALPLEIEAIGAAMHSADKLAYKILTTSDIKYVSDEAKVKSFWETNKDNYMTKKKYDLSLLWTSSENTQVTDVEIKNYYDANSFNYTNAQGKQLTFDEAKIQATKDLKIKKSKKLAQKAYIAFKKGSSKSIENITLDIGDRKLSNDIWKEIASKSIGDIIKPKVVKNQYVTVKINKVQEPKVMTFEQAKEKVTTVYDRQAKKESLMTFAESTLKTIDNNDSIVSKFVSLSKQDKLESLNSQESLQFLQKLFTSNKEKGIISLSNKVIVYNIIEQKLLSIDENQTNVVKQTVNRMKKKTFESNFLKMLDNKYPTEVYIGGLIN